MLLGWDWASLHIGEWDSVFTYTGVEVLWWNMLRMRDREYSAKSRLRVLHCSSWDNKHPFACITVTKLTQHIVPWIRSSLRFWLTETVLYRGIAIPILHTTFCPSAAVQGVGHCAG